MAKTEILILIVNGLIGDKIIAFKEIEEWSANSPDFNVEENVFAWLKSSVEDMEPRDEQSLREAILKAWNDFPVTMTELLLSPCLAAFSRPLIAKAAAPNINRQSLNYYSIDMPSEYLNPLSEMGKQKGSKFFVRMGGGSSGQKF